MEGFTGLTLFKCLLSVAVQTVKNLLVMQETQGLNLGWEDPLEKGMGPTPVFWPGECHGLYSLVQSVQLLSRVRLFATP